MKLLSTVLLILLAQTLFAQQPINPEQAFYRGREAFDAGNFDDSLKAYKEALTVGESHELLFNLGTAALFAGEDGEALYYLRRAEALAPRDEDTQRNIAVAQGRAKDAISGKSRTEFLSKLLYLHEKTTLKESLVIFALCYLLAMLLLHLRLKRPGVWFSRLAILLLIVSAAIGASIVSRNLQGSQVSRGVILPAQVDVFSGPSDHLYSVFFKLHAAAEVEVLEVKNGWVKISVDEKKGFVPENQIGLL